MLSLKNNFVFIHIPKTGGNSLQSVLEKHSDDQRRRTASFQDLINTFDIGGPITKKKHFTAAEYIEQLGYAEFMALKKVTFVRHPLDRCVSFYFAPFRWMRETPAGPRPVQPNFDKASFLGLLPQIGTATSFLSYRGGLIDFDFVGRFETYEDDFWTALRTVGIADASQIVPHVNSSASRQPISWDDEMLSAVERRFAEDFRNFGYSLGG